MGVGYEPNTTYMLVEKINHFRVQVQTTTNFKRDTMSKESRASHPIYNILPVDVEGFDSLTELALDLRWSWNHVADDVWRQFL